MSFSVDTPRQVLRKSVQTSKTLLVSLLSKIRSWKFPASAGDWPWRLAQHPLLSFGGGAGVILLFAIAIEFGSLTLKVVIASAIGYFVAWLFLAFAIIRSEYFKTHRKRAALCLSAAFVGVAILWYVLLPSPQPPSPTAQEIADEVRKVLPAPPVSSEPAQTQVKQSNEPEKLQDTEALVKFKKSMDVSKKRTESKTDRQRLREERTLRKLDIKDPE